MRGLALLRGAQLARLSAGAPGAGSRRLATTAQALKSYVVAGEGKGGASTSVHGGGHNVSTDLPRSMGGKDVAPQPVELLMSALVGCETATATFVARQMRPRFPLDRLTFAYVAERDERGAISLPLDAEPPCAAHLQAIRGTVHVHLTAGAAAETPERVEFLKSQVERRCPVASMARASGCHMDIAWVLAPQQQ